MVKEMLQWELRQVSKYSFDYIDNNALIDLYLDNIKEGSFELTGENSVLFVSERYTDSNGIPISINLNVDKCIEILGYYHPYIQSYISNPSISSVQNMFIYTLAYIKYKYGLSLA
jgi:hypothetical protein